jgi:small subunit ribosomal protein S1
MRKERFKTMTDESKTSVMEELLADAQTKSLQPEDNIEATVIEEDKRQIWVDLGIYGTGLVTSKEVEHLGRSYEPGEKVSVSVVVPDTAEGYAIVSIKKVAKEKGWDVLESRFNSKETFGIVPFDANKGGLLVEVEGVRGFLPVSQLSAENYPRVSGADKDEILHRLNQLVGQTLMVRILDLDRKESKLIVSEKEAQREFTEGKLAGLKVGDKVKGIVTGVVDFGVFVNVDGIEGLVHISEIAWDRVDNPSRYVKVGETVDAVIIAIDADKLSLSMKQLQEDPWAAEVSKLKVGEQIDGKITRITPFGAFVQISSAVEALVHISELSDQHVADPSELVKVGETKNFRIVDIDEKQHKLSLSLKSPKAKAKKSEDDAK